ncbi:hypothetical protein ACG04R_18680 [Roseateles sp. BYS78W]|uniref:Uncharacterized protein n=1 Tax=Pelomonas candidula TaxID=3299025 RepID=A0ABW7HGD4_9BURK
MDWAESKRERPVGADVAGQAAVNLDRNERSVVDVRVLRRKVTAQGPSSGSSSASRPRPGGDRQR